MENNNRRGSEIFLGVIGVATLVVAIIGATFAYFTATTNSDEDAVSVGATTLSLQYEDKINTTLKTNLIPSTEAIATFGAMDQDYITTPGEEVCIDDNGNAICSVYEFTITNPNTTTNQRINVTVDVVTNGFTNLKYKVYEGTIKNETGSVNATATLLDQGADQAPTPVVAAATFAQANQEANAADEITLLNQVLLEKNTSKTYTMLIWIDEVGSQNSADVGQTFAAGLNVTAGDGTGVTGVIGIAG